MQCNAFSVGPAGCWFQPFMWSVRMSQTTWLTSLICFCKGKCGKDGQIFLVCRLEISFITSKMFQKSARSSPSFAVFGLNLLLQTGKMPIVVKKLAPVYLTHSHFHLNAPRSPGDHPKMTFLIWRLWCGHQRKPSPDVIVGLAHPIPSPKKTTFHHRSSCSNLKLVTLTIWIAYHLARRSCDIHASNHPKPSQSVFMQVHPSSGKTSSSP